MDSSIDRVIPLDELDDFKVAEGDPDVRGWDVLSSDGRKIGEVDNLLVDTGAMKVRYLEVDVDDELRAGTPDKHVLIPIGFARLDEDSDQIFVDGLNSSAIERLPEYRRDTLDRDFETSLRGHFGDHPITDPGVRSTAMGTTGAAGLAGATSSADADFYGHEIYSDDRFYDARRGDTGVRRVTRSGEELDIDTRSQVDRDRDIL